MKIKGKYTQAFIEQIKQEANTKTIKQLHNEYGVAQDTIRGWLDPEFKQRTLNLRKSKASQYMRNWRKRNPQKCQQIHERYIHDKGGDTYIKEYYINYKPRAKALNHIRYTNNKEELDQKNKEYRQNNKDKISLRYKKRYKNDICYKLLRNYRSRLSDYITRALKNKYGIKSKILIGCDLEYLAEYLRKQYKPGMTDQNYGKEWHVDHIIPCSSFDFTKEEEIKKCFHYTNLQPLWKEENLKKSNKIIS